ncbi:uncharacterized protein [Panulirus ornatus]
MWLQMHLWAWAVASVCGADLVGVLRRPGGGQWQDPDTPSIAVLAPAHRRLMEEKRHRFRTEARHRLTTASDRRASASSRDQHQHAWKDRRANLAEYRTADETKTHGRTQSRSQGHRPYSPSVDGHNNRYTVGSIGTKSYMHRLQPEALGVTGSYARVERVDGQGSGQPRLRYYFRIESDDFPAATRQSSQDHHQEDQRYGEDNSVVPRSSPGDPSPPRTKSVNTRTSFHDGHRRREIHDDTTQSGSSTWSSPSTSPARRHGDSVGYEDHLHGSHETTRASALLLPEDAGERTTTHTAVSQDLYNARYHTPDDDRESWVDLPERCCGSKVPLDVDNAISTGGLSRVASAGSVKVVGVPNPDTDLYPPVNVRDLRVNPLDQHTLDITWTAPGDDLDFGTVSRYIFRLSDTVHDLKESRFDLAPDDTLLNVADLLTASDVYQPAGTEVRVRVPLAEQLQLDHLYYAALRAFDDHENASPVSNVARFSIPRPLADAPGGHTTTVEDDQDEPDEEERNKNIGSYFGERHVSLPATQDDRKRFRLSFGEPILSGDGQNTQVVLEPSESSLILSEPSESNFILSRTTEPTTVVLREPTEPGLVNVAQVNRDRTIGPDRDHDTLSPPEPDQDQTGEPGDTSRGLRRKSRKNKKQRKAKKNRRDGKKNRRRKNKRRREGTPEAQDASDTYLYEEGECHIDAAHEGIISLCDARYSLAVVIAYFEQNSEYQHLDYLWTAMHTLDQKTRPPWQRERRSNRRHRRGRKSKTPSSSKRIQHVNSG